MESEFVCMNGMDESEVLLFLKAGTKLSTHSTVNDRLCFLRRRIDNLPTELRLLLKVAPAVPGSVLFKRFKHPK